MSTPAYPKYKESGVEWLGQVPDHWEVKRLGHYFDERREKVSDKDFPPLSVTKQGIMPQLETAAKTDDGDNRKKVCKGDFVINSRSDRKGSSGLSSLDGSVSLINTVLHPSENIDGNFTHNLLRSYPFQEEYYRYGKGIVADLWSTNYSDMRNIVLAIPPLPEQRTIASYLDCKTAQLDTLISRQEQLIELSLEKRRALISHAVTRGLDETAPLKDSGIKWLGQVPEHWVVSRVRFVIARMEQGWSPQCENSPAQENQWGVLKSGCVNGGIFNPNQNKAVPSELEIREDLEVKVGDILMSRASGSIDLIGSVGIVKDKAGARLLLSDKTYRIVIKKDTIDALFFVYLMNSTTVRIQIKSVISGAGGMANNIGQGDIKDLNLVLPSFSEQRAIVQYLDAETAKIDTLIEKARRAIELMKEHRSALIASAVTGKIDVRERLDTAA